MDEVYLFKEAAKLGLTKAELGGKGYGLVEMTRINLPVPPGIVITTRMCNKYFEEHGLWPSIEAKIYAKMHGLEKLTGKKFGDKKNPLLVSVRSGAPMSMPGMMDTILNLGINDEIAEAMSLRNGDRFAYDTYRRFMQLFGSIVLKIDKSNFDSAFERIKAKKGAKSDSELDGDAMKEVAEAFKAIIKKETGMELEQEPKKQLLMSVGAIFESWWNKRAAEYRRIYNISDSMGTAVNIVSMVYGNYNSNSGTGVAFTRNPSTGEKKLYAEVLMNAQGEDVVSGIRTPMPAEELRERIPNVYKELESTASKLEKYFKDMQDFEFTIENSKFYMLQTRNGKRTPQAAVKIAIDMLKENLISEKDVLLRVEPEQLERLLHKQIDKKYTGKAIASGMPASPGAALGKAVFEISKAVEMKAKGESVILVRNETTPEDIKGIAISDGILTSRGGMTSHAAVVTRGMGKPCIVGSGIEIKNNSFVSNGIAVLEGDIITIDGTEGKVYKGAAPLIEPKLTYSISKVLGIADKYKKLGIRANADTPEMVKKAIENGAEGIGLARTERMFNSQDRLELVRRMILAGSTEERKKYLSMIKPLQKEDFREMFEIAKGKPITIRLIDMPLHEFLPKLEEIVKEVEKLKCSKGNARNSKKLEELEMLMGKVMELKEANPMMGQRGVRLGIVYKEIYQMQVEAILEAAIELAKKGKKVMPEIMISQVAIAGELAMAKDIVMNTAEETFKRMGKRLRFKFGTMIETPRASLIAPELAKYAEFFSFGTNDLTQATFAFSRDDVEAKFMPFYLENKVLPQDPFAQVDVNGVGRLIKICAQEGKNANKNLEVGVCGEHGGDPDSIEFFNTAGIDYVSMSQSRIPVAKLAAARAAVNGANAKSTA
ncbi:MAG: pyruvate, phosphate dikinase [Candidatus Micrarchaeia archaeon]